MMHDTHNITTLNSVSVCNLATKQPTFASEWIRLTVYKLHVGLI